MDFVLIAEDEPGLAALLERGLRRHGLVPTVVENAADAKTAAQSGLFSLMLLDLSADGGNGTLAVLSDLRAAGSTVPVIALDGRYGPRDRVAARAAGADEFVRAPWRSAELIPAIQRMLER